MCTRGFNWVPARGPSTSPLDGMARVLIWLSRKSPGWLFALIWLVLLVNIALTTIHRSMPLRAVSALMDVIVLYGYPPNRAQFIYYLALPVTMATCALALYVVAHVTRFRAPALLIQVLVFFFLIPFVLGYSGGV